MESASLVFSSGRPGKGSMVASFFMLTLALVTLTVAALVLFTAFRGWNDLAVRHQLDVFHQVAALGQSKTNSNRQSQKNLSTPLHTRLRIPTTLSRANGAVRPGDWMLPIKTTVPTDQPPFHKHAANSSYRSSPPSDDLPGNAQVHLRLLPTLEQYRSNSSSPTPSLKITENGENYHHAEKSMSEDRDDSTMTNFPQVNPQGSLRTTFTSKQNRDSARLNYGGAVWIRGPPRFSDGSVYPDTEATVGNGFFLVANGSGPRHHNHSGLGQRPIFVPENTPHTHKMYAGGSSTNAESKEPRAASALPIPTALKLSSPKIPSRPTVAVKAETTGQIIGAEQSTNKWEHGDVFDARKRSTWPTEPFQRPHTHDISGDLSEKTTGNTTEAEISNRHKSHVVGSAAKHPDNGERRARNHEGHVPRLVQSSQRATAVITQSLPTPVSFTSSSSNSPPTESALLVITKTLKPVSDLVTTVTEETGTNSGNELEPFTEESGPNGEPEMNPVAISLNKSYRGRSRVTRGANSEPNGHDGVSHKSHVHKINTARKSRTGGRNRSPTGLNETRLPYTGPHLNENHPSALPMSLVEQSVATSIIYDDFTALTSWDIDVHLKNADVLPRDRSGE